MKELLKKTFIVSQIDIQGKKFEHASRIQALSEDGGIQIDFDIHTESFALSLNQKFELLLLSDASSISDQAFWPTYKIPSETHVYQYVMIGSVFHFEKDQRLENLFEKSFLKHVHLSFGGLLMLLKDLKKPCSSFVFKDFNLDTRVFACFNPIG